MDYKDKSLKYHKYPLPGKTAITITKPCDTAEQLSLAYTPGVAIPCLEIAEKGDNAFLYTNRRNLVAVISNGTAVLGLGDIGPLASKPVMEGKAVLFKKFAGIDVFDIEIDEKDSDRLIEIIKSLEPTFGGINLEDIKAPECFYIERELKKRMDIPVFHDDQHGTAVIASAGLINALQLTGKDVSRIKMIISGAGAAAISTADMFVSLGIRNENIFMYDSTGLIHRGRHDLNEYKEKYSLHDKDVPMKTAIEGADVFLGLSVKGILTAEMLRSMGSSPVVFALANPDPEIDPSVACTVRDDLILATGRSDFPNQVNNVLGFPFIFRGALDCSAKAVTENMKMAAAEALARTARMKVPKYIKEIYNTELGFSPDYIIPKPFDRRVLVEESSAVLQAAVKDGVNREDVNIDEYRKKLEAML